MKENFIYEKQAEFCKAISHPKRLLILEFLEKGERSLGEISKFIKASVSSTSQHIKVLESKGLLGKRKEGNVVFYHFKHPRILEASRIVREILKKIIEEDAQNIKKSKG
jgi:ArsR family transcriptional regulator